MVQIVEENMSEAGCYCLRSKPNSTGYINKNKWLVGRFNEGNRRKQRFKLQIKAILQHLDPIVGIQKGKEYVPIQLDQSTY